MVNANITFSDMETNTARENLVLEMSMENKKAEEAQKIEYAYTLNMTKNFSDVINIEQFTSQNTVILNDNDEEYRNRLINALIAKFAEVNKLQMAELELREDENPLIYATPIGYLILENNIISQTIDSTNKIKQAEREEEEIAKEIMKNIDETVRETFNSQFISYQGEQKGGSAKSLLSTVISNNLSNEIKVSVNGMKDQYKITNYMNSIKTVETYNINLKTNEYGYITEIEVK